MQFGIPEFLLVGYLGTQARERERCAHIIYSPFRLIGPNAPVASNSIVSWSIAVETGIDGRFVPFAIPFTIFRPVSILNPPNPPIPLQHIFEEHQIQWVIQIVQRMQTQGEVAFDPKKEVEQAWHDDLQERLKPTVWHLDCGGKY